MRRGAQTLSNLSFLATRTTAEMVSPKKLKVLKVGGDLLGIGFGVWMIGKISLIEFWFVGFFGFLQMIGNSLIIKDLNKILLSL